MLELGNKIVILDGAMGTILQAKGILPVKAPESTNLTHPEAITDIHRSYIRSGSDIIYTNTFGVNRYKLQNTEYRVEQLISAAIANAKAAVAAEGRNTIIALDCGPIGMMLRPNGDLSFDEAYDIFREIVLCGEKSGADCVIFETFNDLLEMKAAILAAKEHTTLPVLASMTFEPNGRTFSGVSIPSAAATLSGLGIQAVGINCSLGPAQILPLAKEMAGWTDLPVIVKPNAGLPNLNTGHYDISVEAFSEIMEQFADSGISILGGCCGTTPEYIEQMSVRLKGKTVRNRPALTHSVLCSAEKIVTVEGVRIIGERINPTGKKRLKEALRNRETDYIQRLALEQISAGAEILDVNVGTPGIDEPVALADAVEAIQSICDAPLQIDSSDPAAIEAALRIYNGKALVNSVNGEEKSLRTILPLVKKYGAAVVGLTLDEAGIPQTAEGRVAIAEKIINRAAEYGISPCDIYIDCLTLTVSAQQDQAMETLRAIREVKARFGVKTVLGVSNISFGLPDRETINATFLAIALESGLDLPIINPSNVRMADTVAAFNVLANRDENAARFIASRPASGGATEQTPKPATPGVNELSLEQAVEAGIKQAAANATIKLLETRDTAEIIDASLIPTLEKVGTLFEQGKIFLPQLIQSATAAQASFEILKSEMNKNAANEESFSRGKIVLATVKGDIHDIGKNIVKVVLENSGYQIIDLGKSVPPEEIVATVKEQHVPLVGLSALMTTTVKNMEITIQKLKAETDCTILVGGAVLTEDYARSIGADYYAKDAKAGMDIAKKVLG